MKKQLTIILIITFMLVLFFSCDTDVGTPPALVLRFSIDDFDMSGSSVLIDYTITNDGEGDLENCKIQIGIKTDGAPSDYTLWTDGVNLSEGESHTVIDKNILVSGTAQEVFVIAAGFDDYSKSVTSSERTIIYYDKQIE